MFVCVECGVGWPGAGFAVARLLVQASEDDRNVFRSCVRQGF